MRRGRFITGAAVLAALFTFSIAGTAYAATPQDICNDLKDGKVDGTYTAAEWTAFFNDPTIQGYGCGGGIVPPPTSQPPSTTPAPTTSTPAPATTPPPTAGTTTPAPSTPAVPLTPAPVAVVAGASKTVTSSATKPAATPRIAHVKGAQHTASSPSRTAAAPSTAVRRSGTLPFTGMQLTIFLLVGLGLVATGVVLRATGRRRSET